MKMLLALPLAALCGCAGTTHAPKAAHFSDTPRATIAWERPINPLKAKGGRSFGPPPPGYIKITAEPMPGWTPEHMQAGGVDGAVQWAPLGPRPITNEYWSGNADAGGRVVSIAPHPTNPAIVYIASASGGIWKTVNGGATWEPKTDELSILNHGAVALDPSNPNVVYAGTGEWTTSSGGDGLFRSTDAGESWTRIATRTQVGNNISKIVIDPLNTQVIHVTGTSGYVRSTDGGQTWSTRLGGSCSDVVVNAADPNVVLVGRSSDGIYRSVNGGTTLTKITAGLPLTDVRRIVLAAAASSPGTVYAAITNPQNGLRGMYKTTTGGDMWTQLTATPNFPSPQGWYDCCVGVSPTNPDLIYAGGVFPSYAVAGVIRSTNGGQSWTDISVGAQGGQLHPDQHAIAFGPDGTLWIGNDGGVWKSANSGNSWINTNATINVSQHYAIALHPTDPGRMIGGTQDNGTVQRGGSDPWPQIFSGDGGFAAYDFVNPLRRYVTYVYLSVYRITTNAVGISGGWSNDPRNFIAPLVMHPANQRTLLGGTNRVWRTTNADASPPTWTPISTSTVAGGGTLNAIAPSLSAPNTIYTGSTTGRVYVTTDGAVWNNRSAGLPATQISDIAVSPTDDATAYVAFYSTSGARVLRTQNHGQSWVNVTGTLPAGAAARALAIDWRFATPGIFVGTGAGVYWSYDHGATWTKDGSDLPNVNIGDLAIHPLHNTIAAGTYGRGVWRASLPPLTPPCYANCDQSTGSPVLNVADFTCFLQRFAGGESYANCDGSTQPPTLNVADFTCFLQRFAEGCP